MKQFAIFGAVVDTDDMRYTLEDVTPAQFRSFIGKLEKGEDLELQINSPGGSVYGGIAIANMIRQLSREGHKVVAKVEGLAASIASVIACACDKVVMGESSMMMIHNCWSVVQGDSNTLRKEAETMDMINEAIVSFYLSKFNLSKETLKQMMDDETWFSGKDAQTFNFKCEVIPDASGFKIAAMVKGFDLAKFNHAPEALRETTMEDNKEVEEKQANEVDDTVVETPVENEKVEDSTEKESVVEEPVNNEVEKHIEEQDEQIEELAKEVEDANAQTVEEVVEEEETIPKAECDKRVSGMQSAMAKQMNDLKKEYEAKIEDFKNQLSTKDKELIDAQAKITSLEDSVETFKKDNGELSEKISALLSDVEEKTSALAKLNASVNTPNETFNWKNLKGKQFFDYVKKHPELVKNN